MEITYGIVLTQFDSQYEDCIITRPTLKEVIDLADKIVRSTTKNDFSLMSELNKMQSEVSYANFDLDNTNDVKHCFDDKYTIPLYFINLLLKQYNLSIGAVEVHE